MTIPSENPVSPIIAGQLPEFVRIDHPTLIAFLGAYYEWLDNDNQYLRSPKKLKSVIDVDTTMDGFLDSFKNEFLFDFPETLAITDDRTLVDKAKLIKNIRSFYKAKGTEKTYDLLFRILYDTAIEFYYPKKDILKLSDGKWILTKTIKISNSLGKQIYDSLGQKVIQRNSSGQIIASGRVLDVSTYRIGIYDVAELSLGGINGQFSSGYLGVEFTDRDDNLRKENRVFSVLGDITITSGGINYRVGDQLVVTPAGGDTGIKGTGRVSEVDSSGKIKKIVIDNYGINYKTAPTISIRSEIGTGFSGTITVKGQAEYSGYYANNDGRLSTNKVMQDNKFYQNFSYVLLTEITIDRYRDVIKRLLNPAGMAFYGKVLLKRCTYADLNQTTSLIEYDVPIIGHYLPYTFLTNDDLNKWFTVSNVVDGETEISIAGYNRTEHEHLVRYDMAGPDIAGESEGRPDGVVDILDYYHYKDTMADRGLPSPSYSDFFKVIGNPFAAGVAYTETNNPLKQTGFQNADPFWIIYQHPNRRMSEPVVARIPHRLKDEFLSDHGAASVFGIPTPTGSSGTTGYWKEWAESVTSNREEWASGFTSGERYVMLSYNPLVPIYEVAGPTPFTSESLTAYRIGTTGQEGNPTFLYDRFNFSPPINPLITEEYSSLPNPLAPGPALIGGKRLYKFTETQLREKFTESRLPTLTDIVDSLSRWLLDNGFNADSTEYVMISLENTFKNSLVYPIYGIEYTEQSDINIRTEVLQDMIFVLRRIKEIYPKCRFGYYNYPRVPSFVNVVEDLYRSFENYPSADKKNMGIQAANIVKNLLQEQDVIFVDAHLHTPSTLKLIHMVDSVIEGINQLNEYYVSIRKKRKRVFLCTSRLYRTNSKETPSFFISSDATTRSYIPEYTFVDRQVFYDIFSEILSKHNKTIDGFYNDYNPEFLYKAAYGASSSSELTEEYNRIPEIFGPNRTANTETTKTLIRKALNGYYHYVNSVTGQYEMTFSATGPTSGSPSYWFPLGQKKIDNLGSVSTANGYALDIISKFIYPIYSSFSAVVGSAWRQGGVTGVAYGNFTPYTHPTITTTRPELASSLGDFDASGEIDSGDLAAWLLTFGNPQAQYELYASMSGSTSNYYTAPWEADGVQSVFYGGTGDIIGYNISYSDFRKITARAFFTMPVGKEFNCTTDQVTPPPFPQVYAEKINGLTAPLYNNFDYREVENTVSGGPNLIVDLEAVRGITGTPTEGISTLIYLSHYGIRTLWAELYVVSPASASAPEKEFLLANSGPFSPTSTLISINRPFANTENPNTINEMFTASYFVSDSTSFRYRGELRNKDRHFMRLKLLFRNSANAIVPECTKVMDFNYIRSS